MLLRYISLGICMRLRIPLDDHHWKKMLFCMTPGRDIFMHFATTGKRQLKDNLHFSFRNSSLFNEYFSSSAIKII